MEPAMPNDNCVSPPPQLMLNAGQLLCAGSRIITETLPLIVNGVTLSASTELQKQMHPSCRIDDSAMGC
ncbi:hypothetical protein JZ751_006982 [Albula glossodonta]|uniref:Uncharacterized protein n=1 Tax=Albula glossodonta TaxID=121402 RepID=A0A8T2P4D0_9TELE|nr:hypothetical protein JZ751_006982 [Albula glossodonta]